MNSKKSKLNQLNTEFASRPRLEYPFKARWSPEPGQPFEVADGVFWLRMPLPIALDHINLWLLRDDDGWTLVDTGYDTRVCKDVWNQVFEGFLTPSQVRRIIVTHYHPDHIGLAAWLAKRCDCKILISKGEFSLYHTIHSRDQVEAKRVGTEFLIELGFEAQTVATYTDFFVSDKKPKNARVQSEQCVTIQHGDSITIGQRDWQILVGNGHSPEHACLYCPALELLISGDQAIPRISSNVSVYPTNRHADPLGDWLKSCEMLKNKIPNRTLILPSHQEPFRGITQRMQQLIDDHLAQLNRLRLAIQAPITAVQARKIMFDRDLNKVETILASGETLAYLNYLLHRGNIQMQINTDGLAVYSAAE